MPSLQDSSPDRASDLPAALRSGLADRYRLERELGAGGMATVYLPADLKHHRKVAIKVLRDDDTVRFHRTPDEDGTTRVLMAVSARWPHHGGRRAGSIHADRHAPRLREPCPPAEVP